MFFTKNNHKNTYFFFHQMILNQNKWCLFPKITIKIHFFFHQMILSQNKWCLFPKITIKIDIFFNHQMILYKNKWLYHSWIQSVTIWFNTLICFFYSIKTKWRLFPNIPIKIHIFFSIKRFYIKKKKILPLLNSISNNFLKSFWIF